MCVPVRALPLRCTFIFLPVNKQEQTRVNQIGHSHGEFQARLEAHLETNMQTNKDISSLNKVLSSSTKTHLHIGTNK